MERTPTEKLWLIGTGIVAFVLALIGYFFFISPQRSHTSSVNDQIATEQTANLGLQARINTLNAQNTKLTSYKEQLHVARLALPPTSGMSAFLRTMQALSGQTATTMTDLTVGQPTSLDGGNVGAPAPSSSSSSSSAAASPAAAAAGAGVYSIPLTATVAGSRAQLSEFLTQLQSVQPRAVLITNISLSAAQPDATTTHKLQSGQTNLQLTMQAFVAPAAAPAAATPAPGGAYPSPSPSSSSAP